MPHKRKGSRFWWVDIAGPNEQRIRQSTGTTDRKEAEALEAKWRLEIYRAEKWGEGPAHTFDELMIAYLKARDGEIKLPPVVLAIKHLTRMFAGRTLETLKRADITAYIAMRKEEGIGPATINRELDVLSASINYAVRRWDWELSNPVSGMSLKQPEGRLRWITRAEVEALIREAEKNWKSEHLADFIRLAVNTGCRKGELLGLEWSRVNLHDRYIRLDGNHTKSGKRRFVPLTEEARQALLSRARLRAEHCPLSP
jgi:integrase